ncbi:MAG: alpha-glucosidase/alpha-galactosidase [Thermoprotei archaeon]
MTSPPESEAPRVKISIIGAGSAVWSIPVLIDIMIKDSLRNAEVYLMDIDEERLKLVYGFAKRYASEIGSTTKFYMTTNRVEAIKDSDFVLNSAMAGGHHYYETMREVSEKYGYYRGINSVEWNMVSDYHTIWGYYQFKLVMNIARDIEDYAPNAWLLNVANPVFELTTLISRKTKVKMIGLCHGHMGLYELIQGIGIKYERLDAEMIGFNHVIWLTKFRVDDRDGYELIDDWIKNEAEKYWARWRITTANPFDIQLSPAAVDMYKRYGLFPIGDTVRGGTWRYHWNLETKKKWYGPYGGPDSEIGWAMYIAYLKMKMYEIYNALLDTSIPLKARYPPKPSGEQVIDIIDSMITDTPRTFQVNVLNRGSIPGIPDDVAVEMPAIIDRKGVHRKTFKPLPSTIHKYVLYPRMMRMEWALEAFLKGGRDRLVEWVLYDVRTKSTRQAEEVVDAILKIPGNEEMARHYS